MEKNATGMNNIPKLNGEVSKKTVSYVYYFGVGGLIISLMTSSTSSQF